MGAGSVRETGEERAGDGIPKGVGSGEIGNEFCNIAQYFAIENDNPLFNKILDPTLGIREQTSGLGDQKGEIWDCSPVPWISRFLYHSWVIRDKICHVFGTRSQKIGYNDGNSLSGSQNNPVQGQRLGGRWSKVT